LELAKQLAAEKDAQARLGAAAAKMQQRLEAAELMRADAEAAAGQLAARLEAVVGASKEGAAERLALQQVGGPGVVEQGLWVNPFLCEGLTGGCEALIDHWVTSKNP
jgi:hypothetical protein